MEFIKDISEELKSSYLDYAMSVIVSRALPDVRDGLKPVQRRILWTMFEMGLRHDKPHKKCARVVGECFIKGTLVFTPKGLVSIEDLKVGDEVYTQNGVKRVKEIYIMPKQKLVEVILENGLRNVCTRNQMFKVLTGDSEIVWKKAEELRRGDLIVLRSIFPDIRKKRSLMGFVLDEGLAYFLGLIAFKKVRKSSDICIRYENKDIVNRIKDFFEKKFEAKTEVDDGCIVIRGCDEKLLNVLEACTSNPVMILDEISKSPRDVIYSFIAGIIDCCGLIDRNRLIIRIRNEEFLRRLQVLLFALGIPSNLYCNILSETEADEYRLEIIEPFLEKLAGKLERFCSILNCKDKGLYSDVKFWKIKCNPAIGVFKGKNLNFYGSKDVKTSECIDKIERDNVREDLFFIKVKEVKEFGCDVTFDIQVDDEHEFIANGMVVHNCLGKYHPHGDLPVYESLVRMAQDFVMRYPLVDGQGNFGSIDGDEPAAMRYCITSDSLVVTEIGLIKICEIANAEPNSDKKIELRVLSANGRINVSDKLFHSGRHRVLRIRTEFGYEIEGTFNHPIAVLERDEKGRPKLRWKLLSKIKRGDYVAINRYVPIDWRNYRFKLNGRILEVDEDIAELIGLLMCKGVKIDLDEKRISIVTDNDDSIDDIVIGFEKMFKRLELKGFVSKKNGRTCEVKCDGLCRIAEMLGLSGKKEVPASILRSSKSVQMKFLKSLFKNSGFIDLKNKRVFYVLDDREFAKQLQILLLNFGIISSIGCCDNGYTLTIYGSDARKFVEQLEITPDMAYKDTNGTDYDEIPFLSEYLGKKYRELARFEGIGRYEFLEKNIEYLKDVLDREDLNLVIFFLKTRYFFDRVVDIRENGEREVYSIRVLSKCHSFVANGFINHNTECRLTRIAEELLSDIDKDTVDFMPNFDATLREPVILPAKIPNLLVNGCTGIAVGMTTNMPPHNLREVCDAIIAYIRNPDITVEELMRYIKGPDFPTGGIVIGREDILKAYKTGRGKIVIRGRVDVEDKRVIIRELPYMVNKAKLVEKIAELIRDGKIDAKTVRDESDKEGIRIVIEIREDASSVIKKLYSLTQLQTTFGVVNLALVNGEPRILNLKDLIMYYVDHRRDVIKRRLNFELNRATERVHILEGLRTALERIDEVVEIIRRSKTIEDARKALADAYGLSEKQIDAVLNIRLHKLTGIEIQDIMREYEELNEKIRDIRSILEDPRRIDEIIVEELREIKRKYGDGRRTEIVEEEEVGIHEYKRDIVILTKDGRIKRIGFVERGAVSKGEVITALTCRADQKLLIFTNRKAYWIPVSSIPKTDRSDKCSDISMFISIGRGESIVSAVPVEDFKEYLLILTKNGYIKRIKAEEFSNAKRSGVTASTEDITFVRLFKEGEVIISTKKGYLIRFRCEEVPEYGRNARGVKAINLREGDEVSWMSSGRGREILVITRDGYVKRVNADEFRVRGRGGVGVICVRGSPVVTEFVNREDYAVITEDGHVFTLHLKRIPKTDRYKKGLSLGKRISSIIL